MQFQARHSKYELFPAPVRKGRINLFCFLPKCKFLIRFASVGDGAVEESVGAAGLRPPKVQRRQEIPVTGLQDPLQHQAR